MTAAELLPQFSQGRNSKRLFETAQKTNIPCVYGTRYHPPPSTPRPPPHKIQNIPGLQYFQSLWKVPSSKWFRNIFRSSLSKNGPCKVLIITCNDTLGLPYRISRVFRSLLSFISTQASDSKTEGNNLISREFCVRLPDSITTYLWDLKDLDRTCRATTREVQ